MSPAGPQQCHDLSVVAGGGSPLLACPQDPITLDDLIVMTKVMTNHGASIQDMNIIRKNVERLKGGKLVETAHPAKVGDWN